MPTSRAQYRLRTGTGRPFGVGGESPLGANYAIALAQAKLKIVSGTVRSGSQSQGFDLTDPLNSAGHTDKADGLNLNMYSPSLQTNREEHIPQASESYKSSLGDGSADITKADLTNFVGAYNSANPVPGDWVLKSAHYTQRG